jgi:predicted RNase H-like HicB family nuclease
MATELNSMQTEDLELIFHEKICSAYVGGMSVIEIVRVFWHWRVDFVHGVLRKAKLIPTMARSEYGRSYDIDARLTKELEKKGYSFGRWCLGWKFDPIEESASLKKMPEEKLGKAHEAVRRDFPEVYFEIYGGTPPPKKIWPAKSDLAKPSLSITWDNAQNAYVAKVIEDPDILAAGHDWDNALLKMRSVQRLHKNIRKLDSALENLWSLESVK